MSIPEIAADLIDSTLSQNEESNSRTIFIVGSKQSGKSTLVNAILDKTDTPRPTLVLEYSFGRKSNRKQGIEKTLCHIWDFGGKLESLNNVLTCIPIDGKYFYCVVVDLSKIKRIWDTVETCIQPITEIYSSEMKPEIIIIGSKYDIFKNYDTEIKKFICITLRSMALLYDAHLIFYSSKENILVKRTKELLQNIGFGNEVIFKEKTTNPAKPLCIPNSSDSWESIGIAPLTMEQLKVRHLSRIPPEPVVSESTTNDSQRNLIKAHPEPLLDKLATLKYEELRSAESIDMSIDDYLLSIKY